MPAMSDMPPSPIPCAREDRLTLTERELFERLGWFTHIRWFMATGTLLLLSFSWYVLGVRFHAVGEPPSLSPAVYVTLLIFLYNALFTFLVRLVQARRQITRRIIVFLALGQIACDMMAVSVLVHHTGGVENYFIILVLLPMVIASELLPQALAYATAGAASLLIHGMAWGEYYGIFKHVHVDLSGGREGESVVHGLHADWVYVLQMTTALTVMSFAMVFIASSISKRLRAREDELEAAYCRLRGAAEAKSLFMRRAGHEMRAPLAAIYSILDAVGQDPAAGLNDEHRRLFRRATRRCDALMELVNDLRRYSRLQAAPPSGVARTPLRLDELVAGTLELFRSQADEAGLTLDADLHEAPVAGDEEMLKQVVTNLVANAIQYTPAGGRIAVSLGAPDDRAVLEVRDTGIGIDPDTAERLFEEFYRSPEARQTFRDGTGLGLAICRRIVEMHGGTITAAPAPDAGSRFTVRLPREG